MMTRKDVQIIAEATAELVVHCFPLNDSTQHQLSEAGNRMANYLERTGPRFDRERFVDAVLEAGRFDR